MRKELKCDMRYYMPRLYCSKRIKLEISMKLYRLSCIHVQVELCQNISRSRNPSRDQLEEAEKRDEEKGVTRDANENEKYEAKEGGEDDGSTKHSTVPGEDSFLNRMAKL